MESKSAPKTSRFHRFTTLVVTLVYLQVNVAWAASPSLPLNDSLADFGFRVSAFFSRLFNPQSALKNARSNDVIVFHADGDAEREAAERLAREAGRRPLGDADRGAGRGGPGRRLEDLKPVKDLAGDLPEDGARKAKENLKEVAGGTDLRNLQVRDIVNLKDLSDADKTKLKNDKLFDPNKKVSVQVDKRTGDVILTFVGKDNRTNTIVLTRDTGDPVVTIQSKDPATREAPQKVEQQKQELRRDIANEKRMIGAVVTVGGIKVRVGWDEATKQIVPVDIRTGERITGKAFTMDVRNAAGTVVTTKAAIDHFELNKGQLMARGAHNVTSDMGLFMDGLVGEKGSGAARPAGGLASNQLDITVRLSDGRTFFKAKEGEGAQVSFTCAVEYGKLQLDKVTYQPVTPGGANLTISVAETGALIARSGAPEVLTGKDGAKYTVTQMIMAPGAEKITSLDAQGAKQNVAEHFALPKDSKERLVLDNAGFLVGRAVASAEGKVKLLILNGSERGVAMADNLFFAQKNDFKEGGRFHGLEVALTGEGGRASKVLTQQSVSSKEVLATLGKLEGLKFEGKSRNEIQAEVKNALAQTNDKGGFDLMAPVQLYGVNVGLRVLTAKEGVNGLVVTTMTDNRTLANQLFGKPAVDAGDEAIASEFDEVGESVPRDLTTTYASSGGDMLRVSATFKPAGSEEAATITMNVNTAKPDAHPTMVLNRAATIFFRGADEVAAMDTRAPINITARLDDSITRARVGLRTAGTDADRTKFTKQLATLEATRAKFADPGTKAQLTQLIVGSNGVEQVEHEITFADGTKQNLTTLAREGARAPVLILSGGESRAVGGMRIETADRVALVDPGTGAFLPRNGSYAYLEGTMVFNALGNYALGFDAAKGKVTVTVLDHKEKAAFAGVEGRLAKTAVFEGGRIFHEFEGAGMVVSAARVRVSEGQVLTAATFTAKYITVDASGNRSASAELMVDDVLRLATEAGGRRGEAGGGAGPGLVTPGAASKNVLAETIRVAGGDVTTIKQLPGAGPARVAALITETTTAEGTPELNAQINLFAIDSKNIVVGAAKLKIADHTLDAGLKIDVTSEGQYKLSSGGETRTITAPDGATQKLAPSTIARYTQGMQLDNVDAGKVTWSSALTPQGVPAGVNVDVTERRVIEITPAGRVTKNEGRAVWTNATGAAITAYVGAGENNDRKISLTFSPGVKVETKEASLYAFVGGDGKVTSPVGTSLVMRGPKEIDPSAIREGLQLESYKPFQSVLAITGTKTTQAEIKLSVQNGGEQLNFNDASGNKVKLSADAIFTTRSLGMLDGITMQRGTMEKEGAEEGTKKNWAPGVSSEVTVQGKEKYKAGAKSEIQYEILTFSGDGEAGRTLRLARPGDDVSGKRPDEEVLRNLEFQGVITFAPGTTFTYSQGRIGFQNNDIAVGTQVQISHVEKIGGREAQKTNVMLTNKGDGAYTAYSHVETLGDDGKTISTRARTENRAPLTSADGKVDPHHASSSTDSYAVLDSKGIKRHEVTVENLVIDAKGMVKESVVTTVMRDSTTLRAASGDELWIGVEKFKDGKMVEGRATVFLKGVTTVVKAESNPNYARAKAMAQQAGDASLASAGKLFTFEGISYTLAGGKLFASAADLGGNLGKQLTMLGPTGEMFKGKAVSAEGISVNFIWENPVNVFARAGNDQEARVLHTGFRVSSGETLQLGEIVDDTGKRHSFTRDANLNLPSIRMKLTGGAASMSFQLLGNNVTYHAKLSQLGGLPGFTTQLNAGVGETAIAFVGNEVYRGKVGLLPADRIKMKGGEGVEMALVVAPGARGLVMEDNRSGATRTLVTSDVRATLNSNSVLLEVGSVFETYAGAVKKITGSVRLEGGALVVGTEKKVALQQGGAAGGESNADVVSYYLNGDQMVMTRGQLLIWTEDDSTVKAGFKMGTVFQNNYVPDTKWNTKKSRAETNPEGFKRYKVLTLNEKGEQSFQYAAVTGGANTTAIGNELRNKGRAWVLSDGDVKKSEGWFRNRDGKQEKSEVQSMNLIVFTKEGDKLKRVGTFDVSFDRDDLKETSGHRSFGKGLFTTNEEFNGKAYLASGVLMFETTSEQSMLAGKKGNEPHLVKIRTTYRASDGQAVVKYRADETSGKELNALIFEKDNFLGTVDWTNPGRKDKYDPVVTAWHGLSMRESQWKEVGKLAVAVIAVLGTAFTGGGSLALGAAVIGGVLGGDALMNAAGAGASAAVLIVIGVLAVIPLPIGSLASKVAGTLGAELGVQAVSASVRGFVIVRAIGATGGFIGRSFASVGAAIGRGVIQPAIQYAVKPAFQFLVKPVLDYAVMPVVNVVKAVFGNEVVVGALVGSAQGWARGQAYEAIGNALVVASNEKSTRREIWTAFGNAGWRVLISEIAWLPAIPLLSRAVGVFSSVTQATSGISFAAGVAVFAAAGAVVGAGLSMYQSAAKGDEINVKEVLFAGGKGALTAIAVFMVLRGANYTGDKFISATGLAPYQNYFTGLVHVRNAFAGAVGGVVQGLLDGKSALELKQSAKQGGFIGLLVGGVMGAMSNWGKAVSDIRSAPSVAEVARERLFVGAVPMAGWELFVNSWLAPLIGSAQRALFGSSDAIQHALGIADVPENHDASKLEQYVYEKGLTKRSFLGLTGGDWAKLATKTGMTASNIFDLHFFFQFGSIGTNPLMKPLEKLNGGLAHITQFTALKALQASTQKQAVAYAGYTALNWTAQVASTILQKGVIMPLTIESFRVSEVMAMWGAAKLQLVNVETVEKKDGTVLLAVNEEGDLKGKDAVNQDALNLFKFAGFVFTPTHGSMSYGTKQFSAALSKAQYRWTDLITSNGGVARRNEALSLSLQLSNAHGPFTGVANGRELKLKTEETQAARHQAIETMRAANGGELGRALGRREIDSVDVILKGDRFEIAEPVKKSDAEETTIKEVKAEPVLASPHEPTVSEPAESAAHPALPMPAAGTMRSVINTIKNFFLNWNSQAEVRAKVAVVMEKLFGGDQEHHQVESKYFPDVNDSAQVNKWVDGVKWKTQRTVTETHEGKPREVTILTGRTADNKIVQIMIRGETVWITKQGANLSNTPTFFLLSAPVAKIIGDVIRGKDLSSIPLDSGAGPTTILYKPWIESDADKKAFAQALAQNPHILEMVDHWLARGISPNIAGQLVFSKLLVASALHRGGGINRGGIAAENVVMFFHEFMHAVYSGKALSAEQKQELKKRFVDKNGDKTTEFAPVSELDSYREHHNMEGPLKEKGRDHRANEALALYMELAMEFMLSGKTFKTYQKPGGEEITLTLTRGDVEFFGNNGLLTKKVTDAILAKMPGEPSGQQAPRAPPVAAKPENPTPESVKPAEPKVQNNIPRAEAPSREPAARTNPAEKTQEVKAEPKPEIKLSEPEPETPKLEPKVAEPEVIAVAEPVPAAPVKKPVTTEPVVKKTEVAFEPIAELDNRRTEPAPDANNPQFLPPPEITAIRPEDVVSRSDIFGSEPEPVKVAPQERKGSEPAAPAIEAPAAQSGGPGLRVTLEKETVSMIVQSHLKSANRQELIALVQEFAAGAVSKDVAALAAYHLEFKTLWWMPKIFAEASARTVAAGVVGLDHVLAPDVRTAVGFGRTRAATDERTGELVLPGVEQGQLSETGKNTANILGLPKADVVLGEKFAVINAAMDLAPLRTLIEARLPAPVLDRCLANGDLGKGKLHVIFRAGEPGKLPDIEVRNPNRPSEGDFVLKISGSGEVRLEKTLSQPKRLADYSGAFSAALLPVVGTDDEKNKKLSDIYRFVERRDGPITVVLDVNEQVADVFRADGASLKKYQEARAQEFVTPETVNGVPVQRVETKPVGSNTVESVRVEVEVNAGNYKQVAEQFALSDAAKKFIRGRIDREQGAVRLTLNEGVLVDTAQLPGAGVKKKTVYELAGVESSWSKPAELFAGHNDYSGELHELNASLEQRDVAAKKLEVATKKDAPDQVSWLNPLALVLRPSFWLTAVLGVSSFFGVGNISLLSASPTYQRALLGHLDYKIGILESGQEANLFQRTVLNLQERSLVRVIEVALQQEAKNSDSASVKKERFEELQDTPRDGAIDRSPKAKQSDTKDVWAQIVKLVTDKLPELTKSGALDDLDLADAILKEGDGDLVKKVDQVMQHQLDQLGLKIEDGAAFMAEGKEGRKLVAVPGGAMDLALGGRPMGDLLKKESGRAILTELAKKAFAVDQSADFNLSDMRSEQQFALAFVMQRVFYEHAKDSLAAKESAGNKWDGTKAIGQTAFILNGLLGRVSALSTSGGKSAAFTIIFGIMEMKGRMAIGEYLAALPQDVGSYIRDYKELGNAFGLRLENGTDLYKNGEQWAAIRNLYEQVNQCVVVVFDGDSRGFVELQARTTDAGLDRALNNVEVRANDEADINALSRKAYKKAFAGTFASPGKARSLAKTIDGVEATLADYNSSKKPTDPAAYTLVGAKIEASDGFYELLVKKGLVDAKGEVSVLDGAVEQILRAKEFDSRLGDTGDWYVDGTRVKFSSIEGGRLQEGTSDGSNNFNIAIALYRMKRVLNSDVTMTHITEQNGLTAGELKTLKDHQMSPAEIEISKGSGEATVSRIFSRRPPHGRGVLNLGGSATLDVAREVARLIYGADAVELQGSSFSQYGTGKRHLDVRVAGPDTAAQLRELLIESRNADPATLAYGDEGMLVVHTEMSGRINALKEALMFKYGENTRAQYKGKQGKEAIELWWTENVSGDGAKKKSEGAILEGIAVDALRRADGKSITADDIAIDATSEAALGASMRKRANNIDVDVGEAATNPMIVSVMASYVAGRILIGNESLGRALNFSDSRMVGVWTVDAHGASKGTASASPEALALAQHAVEQVKNGATTAKFKEGNLEANVIKAKDADGGDLYTVAVKWRSIVNLACFGFEGKTEGDKLQLYGRVGRGDSKFDAKRFDFVSPAKLGEIMGVALEKDASLQHNTEGRRSLFGTSEAQKSLDAFRLDTAEMKPAELAVYTQQDDSTLKTVSQMTSRYNALQAKSDSVDFKSTTETHNILVKDPLAILNQRVVNSDVVLGAVSEKDKKLLVASYQDAVEHSEQSSLKPSKELKDTESMGGESYRGTLKQTRMTWGVLAAQLANPYLRAVARRNFENADRLLRNFDQEFAAARDRVLAGNPSLDTFADIPSDSNGNVALRLLNIVATMTDLLLPSRGGSSNNQATVLTAPQTVAEFETAAKSQTSGKPEARNEMNAWATALRAAPSRLADAQGNFTVQGKAVAAAVLLCASMSDDDQEKLAQAFNRIEGFTLPVASGDPVKLGAALATQIASQHFNGLYGRMNIGTIVSLALDLNEILAPTETLTQEEFRSFVVDQDPYGRLRSALADPTFKLNENLNVEQFNHPTNLARQEEAKRENFTFSHLVYRGDGNKRISIPAQLWHVTSEFFTGKASYFPWSTANQIAQENNPPAAQILSMAGQNALLAMALTSVLSGGLAANSRAAVLTTFENKVSETKSLGRATLENLQNLGQDNTELGQHKFDAAATDAAKVTRQSWYKPALIAGGIVAGLAVAGIGIAMAAGVTIPLASTAMLFAVGKLAGLANPAFIIAGVLGTGLATLFTGKGAAPINKADGIQGALSQMNPMSNPSMLLPIAFSIGGGFLLPFVGIPLTGGVVLGVLAMAGGVAILKKTVLSDMSPRTQAVISLALVAGTTLMVGGLSAPVLSALDLAASAIGGVIASSMVVILSAAVAGAAGFGLSWVGLNGPAQWASSLVTTERGEQRTSALEGIRNDLTAGSVLSGLNKRAQAVAETVSATPEIQALEKELAAIQGSEEFKTALTAYQEANAAAGGQQVEPEHPMLLEFLNKKGALDQLRRKLTEDAHEEAGFDPKRVTLHDIDEGMTAESVADNRKPGVLKAVLVRMGLSDERAWAIVNAYYNTDDDKVTRNDGPADVLGNLTPQELSDEKKDVMFLVKTGLFEQEMMEEEGGVDITVASIENKHQQGYWDPSVTPQDVVNHFAGRELKPEEMAALDNKVQTYASLKQRVADAQNNPENPPVKINTVRVLPGLDDHMVRARAVADAAPETPLARAAQQAVQMQQQIQNGMAKGLKEAGVDDAQIATFQKGIAAGPAEAKLALDAIEQAPAATPEADVKIKAAVAQARGTLDKTYFGELNLGLLGAQANADKTEMGFLTEVAGVPALFTGDRDWNNRKIYYDGLQVLGAEVQSAVITSGQNGGATKFFVNAKTDASGNVIEGTAMATLERTSPPGLAQQLTITVHLDGKPFVAAMLVKKTNAGPTELIANRHPKFVLQTRKPGEEWKTEAAAIPPLSNEEVTKNLSALPGGTELRYYDPFHMDVANLSNGKQMGPVMVIPNLEAKPQPVAKVKEPVAPVAAKEQIPQTADIKTMKAFLGALYDADPSDKKLADALFILDSEFLTRPDSQGKPALILVMGDGAEFDGFYIRQDNTTKFAGFGADGISRPAIEETALPTANVHQFSWDGTTFARLENKAAPEAAVPTEQKKGWAGWAAERVRNLFGLKALALVAAMGLGSVFAPNATATTADTLTRPAVLAVAPVRTVERISEADFESKYSDFASANGIDFLHPAVFGQQFVYDGKAEGLVSLSRRPVQVGDKTVYLYENPQQLGRLMLHTPEGKTPLAYVNGPVIEMLRQFPTAAKDVGAFLNHPELGALAKNIDVRTLLQGRETEVKDLGITLVPATLGGVAEMNPETVKGNVEKFKTLVFGLAAEAKSAASVRSVAFRTNDLGNLREQNPGLEVALLHAHPPARGGFDVDLDDRVSMRRLAQENGAIPMFISYVDQETGHVRIVAVSADGTPLIPMEKGRAKLPQEANNVKPVASNRPYQSLINATDSGKETAFKTDADKNFAKAALETAWKIQYGADGSPRLMPEQIMQLWAAVNEYAGNPDMTVDAFRTRLMSGGIGVNNLILQLGEEMRALAKINPSVHEMVQHGGLPGMGMMLTRHFGAVSELARAGVPANDLMALVTGNIGVDIKHFLVSPKEAASRIKELDRSLMSSNNRERLVGALSALAGFVERPVQPVPGEGYFTRDWFENVMRGENRDPQDQARALRRLLQPFARIIAERSNLPELEKDIANYDVVVVDPAEFQRTYGAGRGAIDNKVVLSIDPRAKNGWEEMTLAEGVEMHEALHKYVDRLREDRGLSPENVSEQALEAAINRMAIGLLNSLHLPEIAQILERDVMQGIVDEDKEGTAVFFSYDDVKDLSPRELQSVNEKSHGLYQPVVLVSAAQYAAANERFGIPGIRVLREKDIPEDGTDNPLKLYAQKCLYTRRVVAMMSEKAQSGLGSLLDHLDPQFILPITPGQLSAVYIQEQIKKVPDRQA